MKVPTIISGIIKRPLGAYLDLLQAVQFDTLEGADESLRYIYPEFPLFRQVTLRDVKIKWRGRAIPLLGFAPVNEHVFATEYWPLASTHLNLPVGVENQPLEADFWWDTSNDVFMSFDKQFVTRLPVILAMSLRNRVSSGRRT